MYRITRRSKVVAATTALLCRTTTAFQQYQATFPLFGSTIQPTFHHHEYIVSRRYRQFESIIKATIDSIDDDTTPSPGDSTKALIDDCIDDDDCDHDNIDFDAFEECWKSTSWTVHCHDNEKVNDIVRCFNSPAPPVYYALQRALNLVKNIKKERHDYDYGADKQVEVEQIFKVFTYLLKSGYRFAIRIPSEEEIYSESSDLEWKILPFDDSLLRDGWRFVEDNNNGDYQHTLEIARKCQELVVEASEKQVSVDQEEVSSLVDLAMVRLNWTLGLDIRGRSSADAAFCFAMAGIKSKALYQILATISFHELKRIGMRPSFPTTYILHIVEKLAAAGITGKKVEKVYGLAGEILKLKDEHNEIAELLQRKAGTAFGLHSDRPLLWLWRFAARQSKVKPPEKFSSPMASSTNTDATGESIKWIEELRDPHRPLVVDIGSGMGLSILGLATLEGGDSISLPGDPVDNLNYSDCNFLGVDLSQLLVGYSQSILERLEIGEYVQFVCKSAESILQEVQFYPGSVALIMIQFPTPFRLLKEAGDVGNSQLPADLDSGFMASSSVLDHVSQVLQDSGGNLLLQSNCEDVAVTMRNICISKGMTHLDASSPVTNLEDDKTAPNIPQRTQAWIQLGGERAIGPGWSNTPLLPRRGQTETEVACMLHGTAVHRCILKC